MERNNADSYESVLDAREIVGEPFGDIMNELTNLSHDGSLLLINSFEPEPLYEVFEERGFEYSTTHVADEKWHIEVTVADTAE